MGHDMILTLSTSPRAAASLTRPALAAGGAASNEPAWAGRGAPGQAQCHQGSPCRI